MSKNRQVEILFDFISPFSYLLHEQLHRIPNNVEVKLTPVLFAALLKHWGHLGPVEIEQKRLFTYRHTTWLAEKLGIPFRTPDIHPFNPLPYLRLSIALDNTHDVVSKIFQVIWTKELDPTSEECWNAVCSSLGVRDATPLISAPAVKDSLRSNTELAIELGVYGVPTLCYDNELFWGLDSLDVLLDYLEKPDLFNREAMTRLKHIKDGTKAVND